MPDVDYRSEEIFYFNGHRDTDLVLRLQSRYDGFDQSLIPTLVESSLVDTKVIGEVRSDDNFGTGHLIFYVPTNKGQLVVRTNRFLQESEHYMALEELFTKESREAGIPTNTVLFADTSRELVDFDYQIMELLPGRDLEMDWNGNKEDYDRISYELGKLVAMQHRIKVKGWGRFKRADGELVGSYSEPGDYLKAYLDYDLNVMEIDGLINHEIRGKIEQYFEVSSGLLEDVEPCLVHHDIADHNIRYKGDEVVALFDWENAVAYDPVSDIGSAHTWVCHYPRRKEMTRGYLDELGYEPDNFKERVTLHFLRTMLWKSAFALKGNRFSERHRGLLADALCEARIIESREVFML